MKRKEVTTNRLRAQQHYHHVRDEIVRRVVVHKVHELKRLSCLHDWEVDDLDQQLTLHLLESCAKYSTDRGPFVPFAVVVVEHRAASLIRNELAQKRGAEQRQRQRHLDDTVLAVVDDTADLKFDLARCFAALPESTRRFAETLMYESMSEAAHSLNQPRTTLYEERARAKALFERSGLEKYLE
jgi:hypothetical protein